LQRKALTKNWVDWIDYWSVDFDYESKKEIIRVEEDGEIKEVGRATTYLKISGSRPAPRRIKRLN